MRRQNADVEWFSRCSVYLELFFNEKRLALATGLLARTSRGIFLITALHNLNGREPNGSPKSRTGGVPNWVQITRSNFETRLPLYDQDNNPDNNYLFWRHPRSPKIDICALPILEGGATSALDPSFLDPVGHAAYVKLSIAQLCFVIGYPEGLFVCQSFQSVLSIWKAGHIASEPGVYIDGVPKVLIDAATCEGMSGVPFMSVSAGVTGFLASILVEPAS